MKRIRMFALLMVLASMVTTGAKSEAQAPSSQPSLAVAVDRKISAVEKQILDAAEAMP
jgi:hypothetical protein